MQQFSTQRSSNAPLLIALVGVGALAFVLSSPRRRHALAAAGQSALDAGSRLSATSADRLRELIPDRTQELANRLSAKAAGATDDLTSTVAGNLHDLLDRASELMREAVARARRLPAEAERSGRDQLGDLRESASETQPNGTSERSSARGLIIAAAAVGAGLYALQRYGGSERVREQLGADESGTIVLMKTLFIEAPIEQVFDTWAKWEDFPRFMSNVQSVQPVGDDRSHWKIRGPAGISVEFDSVAHLQRPTELTWKTEPGSTMQNDGRVTLAPEGSGTRVTVRLSYSPPAGALGQAASSLLGADPKQEFEDDMQRMKQFIESRLRETQPPV
jgi:uncharacterized membrane protein